MLTFISQPQNLAPIDKGLIFHVVSDEKTTFNISIIESQSGATIAKKVVKQATEAIVDIAPYTLTVIDRQPKLKSGFGLSVLPIATFHIEVETDIDWECSDEVTICCNHEPLKNEYIQSVFGNNRIISHGEQEDILLWIPTVTTIDVVITSQTNEVFSTSITAPYGLTNLHIDTALIDPQANGFKVEIFYDENIISTLIYNFVVRRKQAVRLMWFTPSGAIEHYTFDTKLKQEISVTRSPIYKSTSGAKVIEVQSVERQTLRSAALSQALAKAVASVASSPRVWIEDRNNTEVKVVDQSVEVYNNDKATLITLTIETDPKKITL